MRCIGPNEGPSNYAARAFYRFVLECGRLSGALQTDQAHNLRALLRDVVAQFRVETRVLPAYSS
eukprot:7072416-Lingulodinium_polyedra.AAC.1